MAKSKLKKVVAEFELLGTVKVNDYTFDIDKDSKNSSWVGSRAKLFINCGENGEIFAETPNAGYFPDKEGTKDATVIYAHGLKASDNDPKKMIDDYQSKIQVAWEDRFNEEILETLGGNCFTRVSIEVDTTGKTVTERFLSPYDAVEYLNEHLVDGMVVKVAGKMVHSIYNDEPQIKKELNYIGLSKVKPEDTDKFYSKFTQTLYVEKDACGKYDKETKSLPISAYAVDYVGKVTKDGKTKKVGESCVFAVKYQLPLLNRTTEVLAKLAVKMFKAKKGEVNQVTVEGIIRKAGGADTELTIDDLPVDVRELVEMEAYTLEEALELAVGKKSYAKEEFLILKPQAKLIGDDDNKTLSVQIAKGLFKTEDLITYQMRLDETFGEDDDPVEDPEETMDDDEEKEMEALMAEMNEDNEDND